MDWNACKILVFDGLAGSKVGCLVTAINNNYTGIKLQNTNFGSYYKDKSIFFNIRIFPSDRGSNSYSFANKMYVSREQPYFFKTYHINLIIQKMKVYSYASQVFSATVVAGTRSCSEYGKLLRAAETTVKLKELNLPCNNTTNQREHLIMMLDIINNMRVIDTKIINWNITYYIDVSQSILMENLFGNFRNQNSNNRRIHIPVSIWELELYIVPLEAFLNYINELDNIFTDTFSTLAIEDKVKWKIKKLLDNLPFTHPYPKFNLECLKSLIVRIRIFHAIKKSNKHNFIYPWPLSTLIFSPKTWRTEYQSMFTVPTVIRCRCAKKSKTGHQNFGSRYREAKISGNGVKNYRLSATSMGYIKSKSVNKQNFLHCANPLNNIRIFQKY
ncbi:Uncharacterized protein FWK35_00019932, partial [Aphis craccivora]